MSFDPITKALCKGGGGLPFVELETEITLNTSEPIEFSESDSAKLDELYNSGTMCFAIGFSFPGGLMTDSAVLTKVQLQGRSVFTGLTVTPSMQIGVIILSNEDGKWGVSIPELKDFL